MAKPIAPPASSPTVRRIMQAIPQRDTTIELRLRSKLHRLGLRFRVHAKPLSGSPRRADIVFRKAKVAVFIDGCFWHGCSEHSRIPKTNSSYWGTKIEMNRTRDGRTDLMLAEAGWLPLRYWAHDSVEDAVKQIHAEVYRRIKSK